MGIRPKLSINFLMFEFYSSITSLFRHNNRIKSNDENKALRRNKLHASKKSMFMLLMLRSSWKQIRSNLFCRHRWYQLLQP
mmetsp:Transcript_16020/g.18434  ORF Transcript_16020/g.18434 Transcript_16020/m.18434 type:complete len:81 (+) Transcript_16020:316-558(+)